MKLTRKVVAALLFLFFSIGAANAATLSTPVITDGGCEGIFVDVTAKSQAVHVTGLKSVVVGTDDVSVYYKTGSYSGFEGNAGAWSLLNTATMTGGSGVIQTLYPVSVGDGITIPAGQTYGFLIWINNAAGSTVKAIRYDVSGLTDTTEDESIRIYSGSSSCGGSVNDPFDGTSNIRAWRGSVIYNIVSPIPALSDFGLIILFSLLTLSTMAIVRRQRL